MKIILVRWGKKQELLGIIFSKSGFCFSYQDFVNNLSADIWFVVHRLLVITAAGEWTVVVVLIFGYFLDPR